MTDLRSKLIGLARGAPIPKNGGTGGTGGTVEFCSTPKPLMFHSSHQRPRGCVEQGKLEVETADDAAAVAERVAIAIEDGGVPAVYSEGFARMQVQRFNNMSIEEQQQATNDAGLFLDRWGDVAAEYGWTAGNLFDVPRDGSSGGLIWQLHGRQIRALSPDTATTADGDALTRSQSPEIGLLVQGRRVEGRQSRDNSRNIARDKQRASR